MRKRKGVITIEFLLIMFAIFGAVLALSLLFVLLSDLIYGKCWNDPKKELTNLKNGDNLVDFRGCVQKVMFVDLDGLTDPDVVKEVNIYDCDKDRNRLKGSGSFIIMIPVNYSAGVFDYLSNPLKAYQKTHMKTVCIWKSYGIQQRVVFEGANEKHCIHMEDYQTTPTNVKIIAPCVNP